jgi:hypothetical protein
VGLREEPTSQVELQSNSSLGGGDKTGRRKNWELRDKLLKTI